jgi:dethiobiotin synthetase
MARIVAVTGTDTGVGKTFVSVALARAIQAQGPRVVAIKPIETGCGALVADNEDGVRLGRATNQMDPTHALIRMRSPVTPALAAHRENVQLDLPSLAATTLRYGTQSDWLLIEGAGGLLSPLTMKESFVDFIQRLDVAGQRVIWILVAQDRLGTLHVTRATLEAMRTRAIEPAAIVLSSPELADDSTGTNLGMLEILEPQLPKFVLPRCEDVDAVRALEKLASTLVR